MTTKPNQPAVPTTTTTPKTPVVPIVPDDELDDDDIEDEEEETSTAHSEEYHAPVYGDTVYVVDGNEKNVKAQVLDPTFRDGKKIKVMVVPSSSQPFPSFVAYDVSGAQNTWHWKEITDDA
jgi:hypothetical protein